MTPTARARGALALVVTSVAIACVAPPPVSSPAPSSAAPVVGEKSARRERVPNGDRDRDSVVNAMDQCPDISEDLDHVLDEDGCPEEDADNDGTPDLADACPREPGSQRVEPNKNGCPYVDHFAPADIRILELVHFAYADATTISDESKGLLDLLARALKENPQLRKIEIRGNASSDEPTPDELGERRAGKVRDELVSRGVEASRLTTSTRGTSAPRSDDKTTAGRADNRRVEFVVLEQ